MGEVDENYDERTDHSPVLNHGGAAIRVEPPVKHGIVGIYHSGILREKCETQDARPVLFIARFQVRLVEHQALRNVCLGQSFASQFTADTKSPAEHQGPFR
jgi:hypothetical protein